jgi:hypothetical protein
MFAIVFVSVSLTDHDGVTREAWLIMLVALHCVLTFCIWNRIPVSSGGVVVSWTNAAISIVPTMFSG